MTIKLRRSYLLSTCPDCRIGISLCLGDLPLGTGSGWLIMLCREQVPEDARGKYPAIAKGPEKQVSGHWHYMMLGRLVFGTS